MKVLVACEESQRVCIAFRERGHEAYSCDILEPSGGHPEWHIQGDVLPILGGCCVFKTMDGATHDIPGKWDLLIAHPPCTFLSHIGNRCYSLRVTPAEKVVERMKKQEEAIVFFMHFILADCPRICVENPKGVMSRCYMPPTQYIDPYMFAENIYDAENYVCKRTGLWLKGVPLLRGNNLPRPPRISTRIQSTTGIIKANTWTEMQKKADGIDRQTLRSRTFPAIARAMAEQWG